MDALPAPPPAVAAAPGEQGGVKGLWAMGASGRGPWLCRSQCPGVVTWGGGVAAPRGTSPSRSLRSTKPDGPTRSARGWSWAAWRGAGRPEPHAPKHRQQVQLVKPTTFYFHVTSSVKGFQTLGQYNHGRCDVGSTGQRPRDARPRSQPAQPALAGTAGSAYIGTEKCLVTHNAGIQRVNDLHRQLENKVLKEF